MSENQSLGLVQKNRKVRFFAWILTILYTIFICVPIAVFIYVTVHLFFAIIKIHKFLKKTIKNENSKFEPKSFEGLP